MSVVPGKWWGNIRSVLYWDIETNKMPSLGLKHRSEQFSYLAMKQEEIWRSDKLEDLLHHVQMNINSLSELERRNFEIVNNTRNVKVKIPTELITNLSGKSNTTNQVWKKAKHAKDFSIVKSDMEELFQLNRDYATKLADIKGMGDPFDALIDQRDEGLNSSAIASYFKEAKDFLIPFLKSHQN